MAIRFSLLAVLALVASAGASPAAPSPIARRPATQGAAWTYPQFHLGPPAGKPRHAFPVDQRIRPDQSLGSWQNVKAAAPFGSSGGGQPLLLTDGRVFISNNEANWYFLTPDRNGSYVNGTWSPAATMPSGYGPLDFASAVLADGKVEINGGEFNFLQGAETNLGAIYDAVANSWATVPSPDGLARIGDGQSVVLADGTYMMGNCCTNHQYLLDESNFTWTQTGAGKFDPNMEEGWTLLPSGEVLTADVGLAPHSELYDPTTGTWSSAGTLPVKIVTGNEIGPQVLRPDGSVFVAGANGESAIYNSGSGAWIQGPTFPTAGGQQLDIADGPGSALPNGNVFMVASPGLYNAPAYFFEFDGTNLIAAPNPSDAGNSSSYLYRLIVLPTGQVLETDFDDTVEIFTPHNRRINPAYRPTITSLPRTLRHGKTYAASGVLFNGLSQTNFFGDDAQNATNYPLVRITNTASGHVMYCRTHDHSSMAVASPATVSTHFDIPATIETGASTLEVVANGIPSKPMRVTVK